MNRGMVTLAELLPGYGLPEPQPKSKKDLPPPAPVKPREKPMAMIGGVPRDPINKQAAMVVAPATSWLSKPLPPESAPNGDIERLTAENQTLKNTNQALVKENEALKRRLDNLETLLKARQKKPRLSPIPPRVPHPANRQSPPNHKAELLQTLRQL